MKSSLDFESQILLLKSPTMWNSAHYMYRDFFRHARSEKN